MCRHGLILSDVGAWPRYFFFRFFILFLEYYILRLPHLLPQTTCHARHKRAVEPEYKRSARTFGWANQSCFLCQAPEPSAEFDNLTTAPVPHNDLRKAGPSQAPL
jgi:hypothetical protein